MFRPLNLCMSVFFILITQQSPNQRVLCPRKDFPVPSGNYCPAALSEMLWAVMSTVQISRRLCNKMPGQTRLLRVSLCTVQLGDNTVMWWNGNSCSWGWGFSVTLGPAQGRGLENPDTALYVLYMDV